MNTFEFMNYVFPLNIVELKLYLESNDFNYKEKNNVIVFSLKNKMTAFVICDNSLVKYIKTRFISLGWNEKNDVVQELNNKYTLVSHSLETNTRVYVENNISFVYSDISLLEATFQTLTSREETIKNKISKKLNSSFDRNDKLDFIRMILELLSCI